MKRETRSWPWFICLGRDGQDGEPMEDVDQIDESMMNANLPIRQYLDAHIMPQLIEALE